MIPGPIDSVAIVGASGRMGGLYAAHCRAAGVSVAGLDKPLQPGNIAVALENAQAVILSVPAQALDPVLDLLEPSLTNQHIVADVTSVKVWPMQRMLARHAGPVVGCHPLFGPEPPEEPRVAVIPGRKQDEPAAQAMDELHRRLGFVPFRTSAEAHDKAMGLIQGLNFATTAAYLAALSQQPELKDFLTPSFQRRLDAARSMCTDDAELFTTLFEANPYSQDAVRLFRNYLQAAASGDVAILVELAKRWWPQTNGQ